MHECEDRGSHLCRAKARASRRDSAGLAHQRPRVDSNQRSPFMNVMRVEPYERCTRTVRHAAWDRRQPGAMHEP